MKFFRFVGYFMQLRSLLGLRAAVAFSFSHLLHTVAPPRGGALARIPVGQYVFCFPSLPYFLGLFSEIFFQETYYIESTQKDIRVIDCGANIGVSLLYIKIRAPHAQVVCFEPNPAARSVLEKNIEANKWQDSVRVFPYALGKEKGSVDFFVENKVASSSGGSTADYLGNKGRVLDSYKVAVEPLSDFLSSPIDILKMDIEGGEFDVLEELIGKDKLRHVAAMQLEYHFIPGYFDRPLSDMLVLLESQGFHVFVKSLVPPHQATGHATPHAYMVFAWR